MRLEAGGWRLEAGGHDRSRAGPAGAGQLAAFRSRARKGQLTADPIYKHGAHAHAGPSWRGVAWRGVAWRGVAPYINVTSRMSRLWLRNFSLTTAVNL